MSTTGPLAFGFDRPVPPNGYGWWYVDGFSADGRYGLTLIAFIGSVFSPYYAWARRRGPAEPQRFCSLNVVLTGPGASRWTMTERGASALSVRSDGLAIGPSTVRWDGDALVFDIAEMGAPLPRPVRGQVRVIPETLTAEPHTLDPSGRHRWWPIAPRARVEVRFSQPDVRWSGTGYLDSNWGDEPLEAGFVDWDWSRADTAEGAAILYEVVCRDGSRRLLALAIGRDGRVERFDAPARVAMRPTGIWRIARGTRSDPQQVPAVTRTLVDAPFYARSLISTRLFGQSLTAMHESLSLDRFTSPWVQAMLPFRMPRVPW